MEINVAGTNALGDYLVSEIANVRTLMGLAPQLNTLPLPSAPSSRTPAVSSSGSAPAVSSSGSTPTGSPSGTPTASSSGTPAVSLAGTPTVSSAGTPAAPVKTDFRALALSQALANTEALFGIQSATSANASSLPVLSTQTPQQIAYAAVQSSQIALQFSNIETLFGSGGIGGTTNTQG